MSTTTPKQKLLLIGWDAADWKVILPMIEAGELPNLKKLMQRGAYGRLATLDPPLSPILWTSIATGKLPYKHGILGFTEPNPNGEGIRPITNRSRKTKAFWNILTQEKRKTHVVGWWPSHPAEEISGTMVSNFYQAAPKTDLRKDWPMVPGTVSPDTHAEILAKMRIHPMELTEQHILPFVPKAASIDQRYDHRLAGVAKITAECSTIHAAATYLMEHEDWDVMAVYYDAIDHYCHGYMRFHPPQQAQISDKDFELYSEVVKGGYRYHDMMLARLLDLAGEDCTIMLISDHGFHPGNLRPATIPKEPSGPAIEHSPYGIMCLAGPGVKQGEEIIGASLLDVAPTLLSLMGLPVGEDMDGKVLVNVLENPHLPRKVMSWDQIGPALNMALEEKEGDKEWEQHALQHLVELGYIEAPTGSGNESALKTQRENSYYLALSFMHIGDFDKAMGILVDLYEDDPLQFRYGLQLLNCYLGLYQMEEARELFEELKPLMIGKANQEGIKLLEVQLLMGEHKIRPALQQLNKLAASNHPNVLRQVGRLYTQMGRWQEANEACKKELALDPESGAAWFGHGVSLLKMEEYEEALAALLKAAELLFNTANIHYYLGETLVKLDRFEEAVEAFKACLSLDPHFVAAREWLVRLYREKLEDSETAEQYRSSIAGATRGEIVIVSGLPRSGTSMMMQMLEAGGMEIFSDEIRKADESNPRGYYEHNAVKRLGRDKRWVGIANNKAVKVVAPLLKHLPRGYSYKVIFMERDLAEVMASQSKMLSKLGHLPPNTMPLGLDIQLQKILDEAQQWMANKVQVQFLKVQYSDVLKNPFFESVRINHFLGEKLAPEKMLQVVRPELYREQVLRDSDTA